MGHQLFVGLLKAIKRGHKGFPKRIPKTLLSGSSEGSPKTLLKGLSMALLGGYQRPNSGVS